MTKLSPSQEIVRLAFSFIPARAIYVAAKYRLAEVIGDEEKSVDYIAEITGLDPDALGRVCRLLASIGVLQETNDKSFAVTKVGRMLSSNEENSLRDYIILYHELAYKAFEHMPYSVESGAPSWAKAFGKPIFETIQDDANIASLFHSGLKSRSSAEIAALLEAYDFSKTKHIIDVGGGNGNLLSAILAKYPHLSGTLFDMEPAIEAAKAGKGGLLPRCELTVGDFFHSIPQGADAYVMTLPLWPNPV